MSCVDDANPHAVDAPTARSTHTLLTAPPPVRKFSTPTMPKRSSSAAAVCTTAAVVLTAVPTSAFLVPVPMTTAPSGVARQATRTLGTSPFQARYGPKRQDVAGDGRAPVTTRALTDAGRRARRSHVTRTSMVFGGGGGRGGGGGFRLDPGTIATIGFGLLFVFAPGVIFGAFNTLFLVVTVGPILFSVGFNLYNKFNVVDAPCPVCGVGLQGLKNKQNQCPSCGAMIVAQNGKFEAVGSGYVRDEAGTQQEFSRVGDSGVIDVDAIDVD